MTDIDFKIDDFMDDCIARNLTRKTMASYEQTLRLFAIFLEDQYGITQIKKVKKEHIQSYVKYLKERGKYTVCIDPRKLRWNNPENRADYKRKISSTTIANYIRNIKVFFNWLHREKIIKNNPAKSVKIPKTERKTKKTLSEEELKRLFKAFDTTTFHGYRNYVITKLLLDTGMRISECLALEDKDVDLKNKSILVTNTKSRKERYVHFGKKMYLELKRWINYKDRYIDSPYLFPTTKGTPLRRNNFEVYLRQAGKKARVEVHPHQLRNNFAKYYILNGGDWFTLSKILGHSSVEVTQQAYLDFTDEEVRKKYHKHSPLNSLNI